MPCTAHKGPAEHGASDKTLQELQKLVKVCCFPPCICKAKCGTGTGARLACSQHMTAHLSGALYGHKQCAAALQRAEVRNVASTC